MTPEHKRKMAEGRERATQRRREHARSRVAAFRAWLAEGSPTAKIPVVPSDYDYRLVREDA